MNRIKEFFEDILNSLRDTSYNHSEERREFALRRIQGHKDYMGGYSRFDPYIHEDEWNKHNDV